MPNLPEIDTQFLLDFLTKILNTPSPTGLKPHPDKFDMEVYDEDFRLGSDESSFYIYVAVA